MEGRLGYNSSNRRYGLLVSDLWENDGLELRNFRNADGKLKSRPQNTDDYFKKIITWSAISSSKPSILLSI